MATIPSSVPRTCRRGNSGRLQPGLEILLGYACGLKAAIARMRRQGGTIINVTSEVARCGVPLSSACSAAKHGVTGLLEAVRAELAHEGAAIAVCEVLPVGINTPFFAHAKNHLGVRPQPTGEVLEPERLAQLARRVSAGPAPQGQGQ